MKPVSLRISTSSRGSLAPYGATSHIHNIINRAVLDFFSLPVDSEIYCNYFAIFTDLSEISSFHQNLTDYTSAFGRYIPGFALIMDALRSFSETVLICKTSGNDFPTCETTLEPDVSVWLGNLKTTST